MKKFFTILTFVVFGTALWSCSYDDGEVWNAIDNLDDRVEAMETAARKANTDIAALRQIVEAMQNNVTISSVTTNADGGYTILFSDGTEATITNGRNGADGANGTDGKDGQDGKDGKDGANAPAISVIAGEDGIYYWALDDKIMEVDGVRIKAEGIDGVTPQLRINADTKEWEMSTGGNEWTSLGVKAEGTDGDSMFESVDDGEDAVTFTLSDGRTIVIPKASAAAFAFVLPEGSEVFTFAFGEEKALELKGVENIAAADFMTLPQGWSGSIDLASGTVTVTAPEFSGTWYTESILSLVGIDANGKTLLASARIRAIDFSDPNGVFVLNEGNMTSENGKLIYLTSGKVIDRAYWQMNGTEMGNVTQDLFITDGKMYVISQNGNSKGGDGRLVVADAKTLKRTAVYNDELSSLEWPSHIAVVGSTAYIRDGAGVHAFDLETKTLTFIEGSKGALKNRMAVIGDKVFVPAAKSVLVLRNSAVEETIAFDNTITGVIKSYDDNVWVSCSAKPAQICKVNATDYTVDKHELGTEYKVGIGWGSTPGICAKENLIYFCNATSKIYCHDFESNTTEYVTDVKESVPNWGMMYNTPAVHPTTGELYYTSIKGYGTNFLINDIAVFDFSGSAPVMTQDYKDYTHFPAGTYFNAEF